MYNYIKIKKMKKFIVLLSLVAFIGIEQAHYTTVANEKFSSLSGWTVNPTGGWIVNTNLSVSSPSSALGFVPNSNGDSVELISPWYDLRNYEYAFLQFSHICKTSTSDMCQIKYQELSMPGWKVIPTSSYQGNTPSAYAGAKFSHASYSTWIPNDSLATPSNSWWKEENFDVSGEVSYAQVRFKFVIVKGNVIGSQFAYGWVIDNFKLLASAAPIKPPVVEFLSSSPADTVYNTGPFTVTAKIATRTYAPIVQPIKLNVSYTYNNITTYDTLTMTMVEGDSIFSAIIPQKVFGTTITYDVRGVDSVGNDATAFSSFYLKRLIGGAATGYVIAGTGTTTTYMLPMDMLYNYSWTRQLYLANELSPSSSGGLITKLAWQYAFGTPYTYSNQTCYFEAVDASVTSITNNAYVDPLVSGATEVWSGTINLSMGWSEITLNTPFILPPGKNLLVHWHHNNGSYPGSSYVFNYTATSVNQAVYCRSDGSFPSGNSGTLTLNRPNARFYIVGGGDDTNSVALYRIETPRDSVVAAPSHQSPVIVTIKNKGMGTLDSCLINWTLNGVPQPTYTWRGNLPDDFNTTDTIGYYTPSVNQYDTLVIWTSMPNGVYDSTTYDDTLTRIAFGVTGLDMCFTAAYGDTVFTTGPFYITAKVKSRTLQPIPQPVVLKITSTLEGVPSNDSVPMTYIGNDIYACTTPQYAMGSNVNLSITVRDSVGNDVSIYKDFYLKRGYVLSFDSITVDQSSSGGVFIAPFYTPSAMCWSKSVYSPYFLGNRTDTVVINGLSWYGGINSTYSPLSVRANQRVYFKIISDTIISSTAYEDPDSNGYTLVWSGGITTPGVPMVWFGIDLQNFFTLPPGQSLVIYTLDSTGVGTPGNPIAFRFMYSPDNTTTTVYQYSAGPNTFSNMNGSSTTYIPHIRLYLAKTQSDSNAVALYSIDSPLSPSVAATPTGYPLRVTLRNKGTQNLTSCQVEWELNGVNQGTTNWVGNLMEDFNDTITIGWYYPVPNKTDMIKVWVKNPNGVADPTPNDDTIRTTIFAQAGIDAMFIQPLVDDTVFYNGPFNVHAKIVSRTSTPLTTPVLKYNWVSQSIPYNDSIVMTNMSGDSLWFAAIPKNVFGTTINYSITVTDSFGNIITIASHCYLQRGASDKITDTVIIGTISGTGLYVLPFDARYNYSWTRNMYLSSEIGNTSDTLTIVKIAWLPTNAGVVTRSNQAMYMKAVDSSITTLDPNKTTFTPGEDGATLVWYGGMITDGTLGWQEITLLYPFPVPTGKNLIMYFIDSTGSAYGDYPWNCESATNMAMYAADNVINPTNLLGSALPYRSYNRLCLGRMTSDQNAVGMYAINSPSDTVVAAPGLLLPVNVTIENKGISTLDSCLVHWSLNGVMQSTTPWYGNLSERYIDTITIGYYTPTPGNYDEIIVWVTMPNGVNDTLTTYDDTLMVRSYAATGIVAEYVPPLVHDTVFVTGPFDIFAHIKSLTSVAVPTPVMHLSYTHNGITTYDTVTMSVVNTDSFKVTIPQQPFGTYVTYSITVVDSIGNVITISDRFYVKRISGGSSTGYVIVGTGSSTQSYAPFYRFYDYGWSRSLYLASELNPTSSGGLITKLAWHVSSTGMSGSSQTCYFEGVNDNNISSTAWVDPTTTGGVTQVWTGTFNPSTTGWVEIDLDNPFMLLPGKNLLIHWTNYNGNWGSPSASWTSTSTSPDYMSVYRYTDGGFPTSAGTLSYNRPNARFYIIGFGNDTNSVALTKIISPTDTAPCFQTVPVQVVIKNKGIDNLTSCDIHWTINGVPQTTYQWTGNLAEDFVDTVVIGTYVPTFGVTDSFKIWVSQPNGVLDSINYDDTLTRSAYGHYVGGNVVTKAIVEPANVGAVCFENKTALKVKLENIGTRAITLFSHPITFYYTVSGAINLQDSITFNNGIFGIAEKEFILDSLDTRVPGLYAIDISFYCDDDMIHTDDTISMVYDVNKIMMPYDNVFSTATNDYHITNSGSIGWELDSTPALTPMFGTGALHMPSDSGETSTLSFYSINMAGSSHPTLEFWFSQDNSNPSSQDRVVVKVSIDEGISFTPLQTVYRYSASALTPQWSYYSLDLLNYQEETCLILAFEAISFGGGDMWIDRVMISSNNEIGVTGLGIADLNELVACNLSNKSLKATISNNVNQAIDFTETPVTLTIEVSGAVKQTYTRTLTTGSIAAYSQTEYEVESNFDYSTPGTYYFKAYVNSIDQIPNNDTIISSLTVIPDVKIDSIVDIGCEALGALVYKTIYIKNEGNISVANIPLRLQIDGGSDITETAAMSLLPGQVVIYTFATPYTVPAGTTYDLSIMTELSCDGVKDNDTLTINCCVTEPLVKIKGIIAPSTTPCDPANSKKHAAISLENTSSKALSNQVVYLEVDNKAGNVEIIKDTILYLPAGLTNYRFVKPYTVPDLEDGSPYTLTSYVYAPVYGVSIEACVETVGITEADGKLWHLGQNIPNPATASTLIPYTIPNEGKLTFKLTTITGQLLHAEDIQGESGTHYYEFNTESIVSGIYYYSMEYKGKKFVKKMTIQK
jgi:hypothetical protein